jgi:diamine N-acetyltransferase
MIAWVCTNKVLSQKRLMLLSQKWCLHMAKKTVDKPKIKFIQYDQTQLDEIKALWEGLNSCMGERSTYFKQYFAAMKWVKRKADLLEKAAKGLMRIDLAVDEITGQSVGYIVSSVNSKKIGEIESIFVCEAYRSMGVGDRLMKKALTWMDQNCSVEKIVEASVGNEQVFGFYGRYGFLPRLIQLKQVKEV